MGKLRFLVKLFASGSAQSIVVYFRVECIEAYISRYPHLVHRNAVIGWSCSFLNFNLPQNDLSGFPGTQLDWATPPYVESFIHPSIITAWHLGQSNSLSILSHHHIGHSVQY